ncbi:MAG: IPT/TIG domain-containing protein [Deltaproteobacteria bacterium]|nr:IPT/TIG domain-containing protein [Deltaproteobacteria bacterium]
MRATLAVGLVGLLWVLAGCEGPAGQSDAAGDVADGGDAEPGDVPEVGEIGEEDGEEEAAIDPFAVTAVRPDHGTFQGGSTVIVRGRGFVEGAIVYFDDRMVQLPDTTVLNDNEIAVVTPAGPVGPVEVRVEQGDENAALADGFTYDAFGIDPRSGSVAGGTFVTLIGSGTGWEDGDSVLIDGHAASDVTVVSAETITCRTPSGSIGPADVTVRGAVTDMTARGIYGYFSSTDPTSGGLGGDPIGGPGTRDEVCPGEGGGAKGGWKSVGTLNVTVLNWMTMDPVEEAFVMLGTDAGTTYQGLTDVRGMIVFSGPDLSGRQTVTAAKDGFESTTIERFDATDVTIFLLPIPDPEPGPLPPGRLGATISGELIFESAGEFARGPWDIVPPPGPGEQKAAYVYVTSWDIWNAPPPSYYGGADYRVTEEDPGIYGYSYSVFARPGTVAVVALAGLERISDGAFTPYGMGVARHIITGPGDVIDGVDVYVVHPLDVPLEIEVVDPPEVTPAGAPNTYRIDVFLDLGGDGVFWSPQKSRYVSDVSRPVLFPAWVAPNGELADATYTVVAGAYNRTIDSDGNLSDVNPFSVVISPGHRNVWSPMTVEHFIGLPHAVDPTFGALVTGNHMEFGNLPEDPDFWLIQLQTIDQSPLWRLILPGCIKEYDLPDIATIAGLPELPAGYSVWVIFGIRAPGFTYDEWSYRFLSQNYWSAYTADAFLFKFRE